MRVLARAARLLLFALPFVALLCSCSSPGAGGQKMDAETVKKIDDLAAKERGGGTAVGDAPIQAAPK